MTDTKDKTIGHGIFNSKGCFWCHTKHHNGLNCPDRPKFVVDAFMRGKQAGRDEKGNIELERIGEEVAKKLQRFREQEEKIAALEAEIVGLKDQMDKEIEEQLSGTNKQNDKDYQILLNNRNCLISENARLREALEKVASVPLKTRNAKTSKKAGYTTNQSLSRPTKLGEIVMLAKKALEESK